MTTTNLWQVHQDQHRLPYLQIPNYSLVALNCPPQIWALSTEFINEKKIPCSTEVREASVFMLGNKFSATVGLMGSLAWTKASCRWPLWMTSSRKRSLGSLQALQEVLSSRVHLSFPTWSPSRPGLLPEVGAQVPINNGRSATKSTSVICLWIPGQHLEGFLRMEVLYGHGNTCVQFV